MQRAISVGLLVIVYFPLCLLTMPSLEATTTTAFAAFSWLAVLVLSGAVGARSALGWFRAYPLRGVFAIALTATIAAIAIANQIGPPSKTVLQLVLTFLWFWAFAAIPTYFLRTRQGGKK
jgi:hypothetical protein